MADEKATTESGETTKKDPSKLLFGLLILNMVFIVGVGVIVFLGQKKQDAAQSIDKIAEGSAQSAEHGGGEEHGGGHGGGGGHGEGKDGKEGKEGHGGAQSVDVDARFFNIGDFTANLSGPGASHYIRLNVNFELDKTLDEEEMKKRTPQIRDKVLSLLNSKRPQDLQTPEGRGFLKNEILTSVNTFLQTGKISGVYFSTFVFE